MITTPGLADVSTDFSGLNKLKNMAGQDSEKALGETARQFESLFIQMALKSMRQASAGQQGIFDSEQSKSYRDMYDQQLAVELAKTGRFGLAKGIVRQLGPQQKEGASSLDGRTLTSYRMTPVYLIHTPAAGGASSATGAMMEDGAFIGPASERTQGMQRGSTPVSFDSPDEFVQSLLPHAREAARSLGVDPRVLLAQAALESGWGRHVIPNPNGTPSHNLFGIKADSGWEGRKVSVQTLEYENGTAVRKKAAFRAYDSYAQSFSDYAAFLKENPRYGDALRHGGSAERFLHGLQRAGYATDPAYAHKIMSLYQKHDAFDLG